MNKKMLTILIAVLVVVLIVVGALKLSATPREEQTTANVETSSRQTETQIESPTLETSDQTEVVVTIKDFEYTPGKITVKKGTTVTWINEDDMEHNVMKEHGDDDAHDPSTVSDAETDGLNSPLLSQGESWSYTFDTIETVNYHCGPHPFMQGVVEVVE